MNLEATAKPRGDTMSKVDAEPDERGMSEEEKITVFLRQYPSDATSGQQNDARDVLVHHFGMSADRADKALSARFNG